jgi:quercetin dioxygenase-like cupin family protein
MKNRSRRLGVAVAGLLISATAAFASAPTSALSVAPTTKKTSSEATFITPDKVKYDSIIPKAVDFGTVFGSREKGPHGTFVKIKKGQGTPLHTHSQAYHGVVIQGIVENPITGNSASQVRLGAGSYYFVPAGAPHITRCAKTSPTDCKTFFFQDTGFDFTPTN